MADEMLSEEDLHETMVEGINTGRIIAKCTQCKTLLTPEDHEDKECPRCGPFATNGDPQALYLPNEVLN